MEGIIGYLHPERQIMLFSATFPVVVRQFKEKFLKRPHIINLMEELTLRGITQVSLWECSCRACMSLDPHIGQIERKMIGRQGCTGEQEKETQGMTLR